MSKGRAFDCKNRRTPLAVVRLRDRRLPCFSPDQWDEWLADEYRRTQDDPGLRRAFSRGTYSCPCLDCTPDYQARMEEQGRCCPPDPASAPKSCNEADA